MGQGRFSHADLRKFLNKCDVEWDCVITTHSASYRIGKLAFPVPKGKGVGLPQPRRAMIEDGYLVQLIEFFDLDRELAKRMLPGLRLD